MPSTFLGLYTAYSGVVTYQAAINTTGNNMSNVETKGYTKQETTRTASNAIQTNASYGMIGTGVTTTGITQLRDTYYDTKYWTNSSKCGEYDIKDYFMEQVQSYFTDDKENGVSGFNTLFSNVFANLNSLKGNGADASKRNQFIQSAQELTEYFNTLSGNLTSLQKDCNTEIKNRVDEVNAIAKKIAALNKQINVIELTGARANELRDSRNLLIDELSKIGPVEVTETPITDTNYPEISTGANSYAVSFYGYSLVSSNDYNTLEAVPRTNKVNQTDAEGLYDLKWSNGLDFAAQSNQGGELKALFEMRDGNNEENFKGKMSTHTASGGFVTSITVSPTGSTFTDVSRCNLSAKGTITIDNMEVDYSSFTLNADGTYTFTLDPGKVPDSIVADGTSNCNTGESVDYMGIPYYMTQLNEFVRSFAEAFNTLHTTGEDSNGNAAGLFFVTTNEETSLTNSQYYNMTAANIKVSDALLNNADLMATTTDISQGKDKTDLVDKLLKIKTDESLVSFRGGSSEEFLQCIISDISVNTKSAETFSKNYKNLGNTITNQRLSISGVDNEEEGVNLVKFQHAFGLCSQMVQVMTEIYDRLILETGV